MKRGTKKSIRVGLWGFDWRSLASIDRSRQFYLSALTERYELVSIQMGSSVDQINLLNLDLIVSFFYHQMLLNRASSINAKIVYIWHAGSIQRYAETKAIKTQLRDGDKIIVNCQSDQKILRRQFGKSVNTQCLPLPASPIFRKATNKQLVRRQLAIPKDAFVVGVVGRLFPQKNSDRLLDLLHFLIEKYPQKTPMGLIVGGFSEGSYACKFRTDDYQTYFVKKAERLGLMSSLMYCENPSSDVEIAQCYQSMDMLYHPTNVVDENFGYTVVEAQVSGVPVLAAAWGGLKDTVVNGETGLLFDTWMSQGGIRTDWPEAHRAAERLLQDAQLREKLSATAQAFAEQNYRYRPLKKKLYEIIEDRESPSVAVKPSRKLPIEFVQNDNCTLKEIQSTSSDVWSGMQPYIYEYASKARVKVTLNSQLFMVSSLRKRKHIYHLMDHCWPARYRFTKEQIALLKEIPISSMAKARDIQTDLELPERLSRLQTLVNMGVLGVTDK